MSDFKVVSVLNPLVQIGMGGLSAAGGQITTGTAVFSNSNGVSFGVNGSTVTASHNGLTSQSNQAFSAEGGSTTFQTLNFANANGLTFSNNGGSVQASYTVPTVPAQIVVGNSTGGNTAGDTALVTGRVVFVGSDNITLSGSSNGGSLTLSIIGASGGGGGAAISAAGASASDGTVVFSNSNNVSFGMNGSTVTASITVPAQSVQTLGIYGLGNTTGQSSSSTYDARTLSVEGAGIVSVGWSNSSLRISATQSNQAFSADASSTFQTLTLQNSNGISFSNNGGAVRITHDLQYTSNTSAITSAAMASTSRPAFSADASSTFQTLTLQNSNGVSFSNNGGAVRITHDLMFSSSRPAFSADASSTFQTLTLQDSNGISFSNNGGAIRLTHGLQFTSATSAITSNAMHSSQSVMSVYAVSNTTQSTSRTIPFSAVSFHGAGLASVGVSNGSVIISVPPGAPSPVNFSAGTASGNLGSVVFSNSNSLSFGLDGATITASQGQISIGMSTNGNTAGTTNTFNDGANLEYVFAGVSGITLSQSSNGSSVTLSIVGEPHESYHMIPPGMWVGATATTNWFQSTSCMAPIVVSQPLSARTAVGIVSVSMAASSTQGTLGGAGSTGGVLSAGITTSVNIVIYSRGAGANSASLQYLTSSQIVNRQSIRVSEGAGGSSQSHSYTNRMTYGTYSATKDYSSTAASLNFHTSNMTDLSGVKQIWNPIDFSLGPGQYFIGIGGSTSTATEGTNVSVMTRMFVSQTSLGVTQNTLALGQFGANTGSSDLWVMGLGSFSVVGGGTSSSVALSSISSNTSNFWPVIQFMRMT